MWCTPSRSGERPIVGYRKMWSRIAKLGDLPADITPHVLRHRFATLAADLGYNEPTIAPMKLMTGRYRPDAGSRATGRSLWHWIGRGGLTIPAWIMNRRGDTRRQHVPLLCGALLEDDAD